MKRTKIICTIGPASESEEVITKLVESGMDVARLNFSHGDNDQKLQISKTIRSVSEKLDKPITLIADIQGPKLRLGEIDGIRNIETGDKITLSLDPIGNDLPIQYDLSELVAVGDRIFLNDGLVELVVEAIDGKRILTIAINEGEVSSHKGINIPDSHFNKDIITQKDKDDILFAIKHKFEYIALSFIQSSDEVDNVKEFIKNNEGKTKVCVKIEKKEAVENIEKIIASSDAVMIARGDLAIETSAASVPVLQQKIVRLSREAQKPVIVATQMLESMIDNPRPTRAEASDVGHAVVSQVDCVMLSAESAVGKYPVKAVEVMKNIIESVEDAPEYKHYIGVDWSSVDQTNLQSSSIASAAEKLSFRIHASLLAVASATGLTAIKIASFRPRSQIVAITHNKFRQNQLNLVWGLYPVVIKPTDDSESFWNAIAQIVIDKKFAHKEDKIVMVGGSRVGVSGVTDTIKVVKL